MLPRAVAKLSQLTGAAGTLSSAAMAETDEDRGSGQTAPRGPGSAPKSTKDRGKADKRAERETRLAEALRANLRRRKADRKDKA